VVGLFLLIYSQELLVYYVWGGVFDHFLGVASIYALKVVCWLKMDIGMFFAREKSPLLQNFFPSMRVGNFIHSDA